MTATGSGHYELMFSLWLERAECEFLTGASMRRKQLMRSSCGACPKVDQAAATVCKVQMHVVRAGIRSEPSQRVACLRLFGIELPGAPIPGDRSRQNTRRSGGPSRAPDRETDRLATDDRSGTAGRDAAALDRCLTPPTLPTRICFSLLMCRMVNLSLQHGTAVGPCMRMSVSG